MAVASSRVADQAPALFSRFCKQLFDLSVAEKIFGLLALLVVVAGFLTTTSFQTVRLQNEYRKLLATSASAAVNIGRVNALIYAVVMESRGIYMSTEQVKIKQFGDELLKRNRELARVVAEWKATVREDDVGQFSAFEERIGRFIDFRRELVRRAVEVGPAAARALGDNEDNRNLRSALNADLESLARVYAQRAGEVADLGDRSRYASWYMFALGIVICMPAALIVLVIVKFVTGPLSEISNATDGVAAGRIEDEIPFADRQDEIGRLARALQNFRNALRRNSELEQRELGTAKQRDTALEQRDRLNDRFLETKWQLRAALDNMALGLVMMDSKARILLANAQYRKMYQLPPTIFGPNCKLGDILEYRASKGLFAGDVQATVDTILARISKGKQGITEFSLPDGRVIRMSEQPMDGGGWVATHEDFTQQRRADRVLARTERFLATILENVTQAIVAKDALDLRYVFVNKAAEKLFGLPRAEIMGKSARDLFPIESAEIIERLDRQLLAGDENFEVSVQSMETPNNGWRSVSARRFRIAGDDSESHIFLSMIEDRTDEINAARASDHGQAV
jgi:PAS domain S-box-containing protein